jgi:predicted naringenin-chalcone synthase
MRPEPSREQLVIHSLFGDASVSALVEMAAPGEGVGLVAARTEHLYATGKMMTWDLGDQGFVMTLSPYVPLLLTEQIEGFVTRLLASVGLDVGAVRHWIIHPGGPRIVENIAGRLGLSPADTAPSMTVLEQHGNCSSGTVLLVLQEVLRSRAPGPGEYGVMMAFGPGLTMEGMVVQF